MNESRPADRTRRRRHSKACTRCRKRKIRCDFQYPTCGACSAASSTCLGFDTMHGVEKPRSTLLHLEEEVARLESDLQRVSGQREGSSDDADTAVEKKTARLAAAALQPGAHLGKQEGPFPLTSRFFLSGSPVPCLNLEAWGSTKAGEKLQRPPGVMTVSSIPRHLAAVMLKHYCDIYRPQYPAIKESDLYKAFDKVYDGAEPSDFDIFCVHITLAISTTTLIYRDEIRATTASSGFWATAAAHIGQIGLTSSWKRLQALQLLAHYGLLNPEDVDCVKCAAAATRLSFQLGLHNELSTTQQMGLDKAVINNRRRLFWNSYSIDAGIHTTRCQPFIVSPNITAQAPDFDSQPSATTHIWTLRQIEFDITLKLYYPQLCPEDLFSDSSFGQWFTHTRGRLNEWYLTTRQSVDLSGKIEFYEMLYSVQVLRLNRPSPRCCAPTADMRKEALMSCVAVLREFDTINRLGKLFYIWHAAYCVVESGICLLASVLAAIEDDQATTHMKLGDVPAVTKYLTIFPGILWQISRRWPSIVHHASALECISLAVLEKLQQWPSTIINDRSDNHALKQKLNELSPFPPFSSNEESDKARSYYVPIETPSVPPEMISFSPGWAVSQLFPEQGDSMFLPASSAEVVNTPSWDFAGTDSEELFMALFPGG